MFNSRANGLHIWMKAIPKMYKLTPRMLQDLESGLRKFHDLFGSGRCDGWQLEELLVRAIQSDTQAQRKAGLKRP